MNASTKSQLSVSPSADSLGGRLRADAIRHDTLVQLVQHWRSDDDAREDIIAALDALADAVASPREGELDQLVEAIEDAAAMDDAHTELDMSDLPRLRTELDQVIAATAGRFNPARVRAVPARRERGAA